MVRLEPDRARELRHRAHTLRLAADYLFEEFQSEWVKSQFISTIAFALRSQAKKWEDEATRIEKGPS